MLFRLTTVLFPQKLEFRCTATATAFTGAIMKYDLGNTQVHSEMWTKVSLSKWAVPNHTNRLSDNDMASRKLNKYLTDR